MAIESNAVLNVVHVDNDPETLDIFQRIVKTIPHINYISGFTDAESCYNFLQEQEYHPLIFLDIELSGKSGLWLAEQVKDRQSGIIFVSSQVQYSLAAFEACALDYIPKPLTADKVHDTFNRLRLKQQKTGISKEQIEEFCIRCYDDLPKRIFINTTDKIILISLVDILYLTSKENYSLFYLKDGSTILSSRNIKVYDETLKKHPDFLRIHRSHIVNKNAVRSIVQKARSVKAVMSNNDHLEISYLRKDEILEGLLR